MRRGVRAWLVVMLCLGMPLQVWAQSQGEAVLEWSVGGAAVGPTRYREVSADEFTPQGGVRRLFRAESELRVTPAAWTRVGVRVMPRLMLEAGMTLSQPTLLTRVRNDAETSAVDLATSLTRYHVEGGLLLALRRWQSGRVRPFAGIGAGYLRQVSDGRTLVETGRTYYVGGGVHYLLWDNRGRRVQSAGVRVDVRATAVEGRLSVDGDTRVSPFVGAGLFLRF